MIRWWNAKFRSIHTDADLEERLSGRAADEKLAILAESMSTAVVQCGFSTQEALDAAQEFSAALRNSPYLLSANNLWE